ncbi:uncharacterized protein N0V89_000031 [Didymosphaeria variabile]|uniref:Lysine-specific metallo-endopeptidase domain-containing protein n=1 Tax=Didymosphaeria variabile TaxID=1932322 RepID=A0A9W9CFC8_9PLEO|nr:uncharacterized protein N0V89_000031 [Didymosphaeria variabile]KAJ4359477.1 hypothetical protein N0V89_000031 [Didymosphaeria variabile]
MKLTPLLSLATPASAASFANCNASQSAALEKAIARATEQAYAVVVHLENDPSGSALQTAYYGTFDTGRYTKILTAFRKMAPDLDGFTTLVHEATHLKELLGTHDYGYTPEVCKQIAREDPVEAVDNAE